PERSANCYILVGCRRACLYDWCPVFRQRTPALCSLCMAFVCFSWHKLPLCRPVRLHDVSRAGFGSMFFRPESSFATKRLGSGAATAFSRTIASFFRHFWYGIGVDVS